MIRIESQISIKRDFKANIIALNYGLGYNLCVQKLLPPLQCRTIQLYFTLRNMYLHSTRLHFVYIGVIFINIFFFFIKSINSLDHWIGNVMKKCSEYKHCGNHCHGSNSIGCKNIAKTKTNKNAFKCKNHKLNEFVFIWIWIFLSKTDTYHESSSNKKKSRFRSAHYIKFKRCNAIIHDLETAILMNKRNLNFV